MGLRETLEAATLRPGTSAYYRANGELAKLAPELAAGNLETIDFLRWLISDPDHAALLSHDEACTDDDQEPCEACALLARLGQLGKEPA